MTIRKLFIPMILLLGMAIIACSRGSSTTGDENPNPHVENPADTTAPVITINTPADNQVFSNGQLINMTGRLTDDMGLYRGTVKLINDANGLVLKEQVYEIHGLLAYNFAMNYTASVSSTANYTVTVSFEDHGYNAVTRSVKIKVNP
jgi:phosphate-selective porin